MTKEHLQFIPSNLDLDQRLQLSPLGFPCHKDYIIHIISMLYEIPLYKGSKRNEDGWVSLNMKMLHKEVHRKASDILSYLYRHGIIETDRQYIPGKKNRSYRLSIKYLVEPTIVWIRNNVLLEKIRRNSRRNRHFQEETEHLQKWFHSGLSIDMIGVIRHLRHLYETSFSEGSLDKRIKILNRYIVRFVAAHKIDQGDWYLQRDSFAGRVHTNLTNLPSDIRQFLRYNGHKLTSVDIRNSQPFFASVLNQLTYNEGFVTVEDRKRQLHTIWNIGEQSERVKSVFRTSIWFNAHIYDNNVINESQFTHQDFMVAKIAYRVDNERNSNYAKDVLSGEIYEQVMAEMQRTTGRSMSREVTKREVLRALYADNRLTSDVKTAIKALYPDKMEEIRKLKHQDSTLPSRIMQAIEAYVMIDVVTKRISKEHPELPIFTVHDCVVTIEGCEHILERMMREEIENLFRVAPLFKTESWQFWAHLPPRV